MKRTLGIRGQRSRAREAKDRFRRIIIVDSLGRVVFLISLEVKIYSLRR